MNWEGASLYLHSTEEGPIVRNRSAIWLKSSIYRSFCVNRVSIMHHMLNKKFKPTSSAGRFLTPLSQVMSLEKYYPFITGPEPQTQFAINLTAEQISQSASFQVSASSNGEWVPLASNRNPANNWCHRWVTELKQSKSDQEFYGRAGAKKCLSKSRAKLQERMQFKVYANIYPGGPWWVQAV